MTPSATHLVLIPSYNPGGKLAATIAGALEQWAPVWVVDDGSTDGSTAVAQAIAARDPRVRVIVRPRNGGKGAAVATGVAEALAAGFTHVLSLDADGQHPAGHIPEFMAASQAQPAAMVLGRPVFGPEVPLERLHGRKLSVGLARLEILGAGIDDPLFGFRVYPAAALQRALASTRAARGFDFDPEVAVRMFWAGVPTLNIPAPCRYFARGEGGVSHFNYLRDNLKLIWLHTRLLVQLLLWRWVFVLRARRARSSVKTLLLLLGLGLSGFAFSAVALAAEPAPHPLASAETLLADPARDPAWQALFTRLAPNKTRQSNFEERRIFPFRKGAVVLKGEIRIIPERGLSLRYLEPERRILIVDAKGVLMRDERGRDQSAPNDARAQAITGALVNVLRFDLPALQRDFAVHGQRDGETWALGFVPRATNLRDFIGVLVVRGEGAALKRIEMIKAPNQRIEIAITDTLEDVIFPGDVLTRFFR